MTALGQSLQTLCRQARCEVRSGPKADLDSNAIGTCFSASTGHLRETEIISSSRTEARLEQIDFSDQLASDLVGEFAGPRETIEFGSLGAKPGETKLALDLVNPSSERAFLP